MKKIYIVITILLLTACSTNQPQKVLKAKKITKEKEYSCSDIDSLVNNHQFDIRLWSSLHQKCGNPKSKTALWIAKGDDYEQKKDSKGAFKSYRLALSLVDKNHLKLFDEYRYYLKKQIKKYTPKTKVATKSLRGGVIDSETLEGYIIPRDKKATRDAMIGEFSVVKGIPLNFSSGSSAIEEGINLAQAKEIGKLLSKKDYRDRIIYITGYTDTRGSSQSNQELSIQRANSLKQYLIINFGLKESNIRAEGYGESFPICRFGEKQKVGQEYSCTQEEDYAKSRRVTLEYGE